MFAVVEFSSEQGGGLSLVNKNWLTPRKKEVFWPPYKEQSQFRRSIKKSEEMNTETWRIYVKRIIYETGATPSSSHRLNNNNTSPFFKLVEAGKPKTSLETIPVKLPVEKLSDLDILETFLHDQSHSNLLVIYYSGLGGNNINSKTNRILKDTLDDSAILFNFYGRNNKKPFSGLKLSSCIIDAVKSTCGCTSAQVEGLIKIWLKHAPQRLKTKGARQTMDVNGGVDNI